MPAERLIVHGLVQGVGYRWWAVDTARALGLRGWVRNRVDGTVELLALGPEAALDQLAEACRSGPPAARVGSVERRPADDDGTAGFDHRGTV